jgi:hypothetical protein
MQFSLLNSFYIISLHCYDSVNDSIFILIIRQPRIFKKDLQFALELHCPNALENSRNNKLLFRTFVSRMTLRRL